MNGREQVTIYALSDPRTGAVRYIGQTAQRISMRVSMHLSAARRGRSSAIKAAWLEELAALGLVPQASVLAVTTHADADAEERRQIASHLAAGAALVNVLYTPNMPGPARRPVRASSVLVPVRRPVGRHGSERADEGNLDGSRLRARRKDLGLSQSQLARRLGVEANTVARWEQGKRPLANPVMVDLALQTLEMQAAQR